MSDQLSDEVRAALEAAPVYRLAEPTLNNAELSEIVGELTAKCESLRADLVALEGEYVKSDAERFSVRGYVKSAVKRWIGEVLK
jgi:hypothetical protein